MDRRVVRGKAFPLGRAFVENQDRTFSSMPEDNHNFPENFLT